jgi:hypothetical protein
LQVNKEELNFIIIIIIQIVFVYFLLYGEIII